MKFPSPRDYAKTQHRTLLDVVLVRDVEGADRRSTYRFYALDVLCVEGGTVWQKSWDQRWRFLNEGVLIPRKMDEALQLQRRGQHQSSPASHVYSEETIKIRAVEYFPMKKLGFVMRDVCDGVGHEAGGVRVVPVGRYGIGGDDGSSGADGGGAPTAPTSALIWKRGCRVDDGRLRALLLAAT
jgi:hypothetical protein